jgi:phosphate-selective porin OprO/OprP
MAVAVVCVGISMPAFAQMETKMTGRVHYDARAFNSGLDEINDRDTASIASGFELRRARIGFTGNYNKQIQYEGVANAVGSSTNFIDTAFINYGYNSAANIRVGRFKQPFSLEENTSSNNIDFMERSYVNQMIPGKKLGAMIHGSSDAGFTYAASLYQQDFNELTNVTPAGSMAAMRLTSNLSKLANIGGENTVIHLGYGAVKGNYRQTATTSTDTTKSISTTTRSTVLSFRDENRGLNNAYRLQVGGSVLTTGGYGVTADETPNITQDMQGLELAVATGPFKFQTEYADSKYGANSVSCTAYTIVNPKGVCSTYVTANVSASARAKYISMIWNITGEDFSKTYSKGAWGSIKPSSEFMKDYGGVVGNGTGAWQLAYRYSTYDVSLAQAQSSTLASGTMTTYGITDGGVNADNSRVQNSPSAITQTVGLNWILNSNARVMFTFSDTKFGSSVEALDTNSNSDTTKSEQIFSVRTQFNF